MGPAEAFFWTLSWILGPLALASHLALLLVPELEGGQAVAGRLLHPLALLLLQSVVHQSEVDHAGPQVPLDQPQDDVANHLGGAPQLPAAVTGGQAYAADQLEQVLSLGHNYPGRGLPLPQGAGHLEEGLHPVVGEDASRDTLGLVREYGVVEAGDLGGGPLLNQVTLLKLAQLELLVEQPEGGMQVAVALEGLQNWGQGRHGKGGKGEGDGGMFALVTGRTG